MQSYRLAILLSFIALPALAAEPLLEHVNVYTSGADDYKIYRIPAIEIALDGTLLAFAEGRKQGGKDPGYDKQQDVDLLLKRSSDDGKTWSELEIVEDPGQYWSAANAATVVDRDTGKIWVLYIRSKPGRSTETSRPGTDDMQTMARWSEDNGLNWSEPIDLTEVARDMQDETWTASVPGPGGAIQAGNGRLLVPCWKEPYNVFVIYSDDHGATWHRSELVPGGDRGNENQLVELANGRIMMDMRQAWGPRWRTISSDGGHTWSETIESFMAPRCAAGVERLTLKSAADDRNRILWTGPRGPGRVTLVARVSYDEGATYPVERILSEETAAYSDLVLLPDKSVGCLWERDHHHYIAFTRFDLALLEPEGPPVEE
jgi:sialidase-1